MMSWFGKSERKHSRTTPNLNEMNSVAQRIIDTINHPLTDPQRRDVFNAAMAVAGLVVDGNIAVGDHRTMLFDVHDWRSWQRDRRLQDAFCEAATTVLDIWYPSYGFQMKNDRNGPMVIIYCFSNDIERKLSQHRLSR